MNLVLDFGNTRIKAGVFNGAHLVEVRVFRSAAELVRSDLGIIPVKHCLIGSVTTDHEPVYEEFSSKFSTHIFTPATPIPLKNLYKSAMTLGSDRVAASVGAYSLYPGKNVLTIDAGTCIKYNFVNAGNEYLGGAISPGIPMRLKAMHAFTSALPEVELRADFNELIGANTADSILAGALTGAACEADAMIDRYRAMFGDLQVVITGGDGEYLCNRLKNTFFANQNLLLIGLNTILTYNIEKQPA